MSVYVPPATGSGSSCTGGCGSIDDNKVSEVASFGQREEGEELFDVLTHKAPPTQRNYLSQYFAAHMLSKPSWRYMYLLYIVVGLFTIIAAALHHFRVGHGSYLGAVWTKWAMKNRVVKLGRKERQKESIASPTSSNAAARLLGRLHAQPKEGQLRPPPRRKTITFPSLGRILLLWALVTIPVLLTLIGADYVRPSASTFDLSASFSNITSPNQSLTIIYRRHLQWGIGDFQAITTTVPTVTLPYRTWWTVGGRTGIMINALTPLIVITALKAQPFALLSTRLLGGIAFDRLSYLHKWGGRLVWLFAAVHVVTWSIQLHLDQAYNGEIWLFVFLWNRFRWGFVSFGFLTLLTLLSLGPLRRNYYEAFYVAHVVCAIGTMVAAALHHPPLGPWMWAALAWWALERIVRAVKTAWLNGLGFAGRKPQFAVADAPGAGEKQGFAPMGAAQAPRHQQQQPSWGGAESFDSSFVSRSIGQGPPSQGTFRMSSHAASQSGHSVSSTSTLAALPSKDRGYGFPVQPLEKDPNSYPPSAPRVTTGAFLGPADHADERTMLARRQTRISAQYDPVVAVIDDYSETKDSTFSSPRPLSSADFYNSSPLIPQNKPQPARMPDPLRNGFAPPPSGLGAPAMSPSPSGFSMGPGAQPGIPRAPRAAMAADVAAVIRPGFAFAQLLPGRTLRLTLRTPNRVSWRPGQYVNLNMPGVRWWESHPFTIASAYNANCLLAGTQFTDGQGSKPQGEERTMVLLIRARQGFTKYLWDYVCTQREAQLVAAGSAARKATAGVQLRAIIDGPYGSTARVNWGSHSTVLIICGGSGVSFGMAVLEHLCAKMSSAAEAGFQTTRVRFVWMLREFSHLQWIASAMRRCREVVSPERLHIELYVTHINNLEAPVMRPARNLSAGFSSGGESRPLSTYSDAPGFTDQASAHGDEYDVGAYDLTQFEGEDFSAPTATEMQINERLHKEGKLRRANTRRATMKRTARGGGRGGAASTRPRQLGSGPEIHEEPLSLREPPLGDRDIGDERGPLGAGPGASKAGLMLPKDALAPPTDPWSHASGASTPTGWISPGPLPLSPGFMPERPVLGSKRSSMLGMSYDTGSTAALLAASQDVELGANAPDAPIDLDADEDLDLRIVAEMARPGHPRLDSIVREEAQRTAGGQSLLVTSCGPGSLGSLLRSIVAQQIDPAGIRKGAAPSISLLTEHYEWGG